MKKVLITGAGSYIGTKVELWLKKYPDKYQVTVIDMVNENWGNADFRGYDIVYHVAGIAHRNDASNELYEQVNHILAVKVAEKARDEGVKQFIFMSSGAVYSQSDRNHKVVVVDEKSDCEPSTAYGISKMKAEKDICRIRGEMKIAILRPPMVYGPGAKGNYNYLRKFALKTLIFPNIHNKRSMIYIDNLCEFVRYIIDSEQDGVFLPQNREYVNTTEMVKLIAKINGHRVLFTSLFNWVIFASAKWVNPINKIFGIYVYKTRPYFDNKYQLVGFDESIRQTEKYY